jgi:hypothetical protein
MTRRIALPAAAAAALTAAALPAAAGAQIQVDQGIAGARIGNTVAQVHASLGRPARVQNGRNDFGRFREERYAGGITVDYQGARTVSSITTTGLGDRTAQGIGVGSSEAAVRAKVGGVSCETISGSHSCHTHAFTAGRRVTDFFFRRGKVVRVSLGVVID